MCLSLHSLSIYFCLSVCIFAPWFTRFFVFIYIQISEKPMDSFHIFTFYPYNALNPLFSSTVLRVTARIPLPQLFIYRGFWRGVCLCAWHILDWSAVADRQCLCLEARLLPPTYIHTSLSSHFPFSHTLADEWMNRVGGDWYPFQKSYFLIPKIEPGLWGHIPFTTALHTTQSFLFSFCIQISPLLCNCM